MKIQKEPETTIEVIDHMVARKDWVAEHPGESWDDLPTRKKNALAKDQKYHREFADLCNAITGFRKDNGLRKNLPA